MRSTHGLRLRPASNRQRHLQAEIRTRSPSPAHHRALVGRRPERYLGGWEKGGRAASTPGQPTSPPGIQQATGMAGAAQQRLLSAREPAEADAAAIFFEARPLHRKSSPAASSGRITLFQSGQLRRVTPNCIASAATLCGISCPIFPSVPLASRTMLSRCLIQSRRRQQHEQQRRRALAADPEHDAASRRWRRGRPATSSG